MPTGRQSLKPIVSLVWENASHRETVKAPKLLTPFDACGRYNALAARACLSGLSLMSILAHHAPASANPSTALLSTGLAQPKTTVRTGVDLVVAISSKVTFEDVKHLVPGASKISLEGQDFALISSHQSSTQALSKGRELQYTLPWPLEILVYQNQITPPAQTVASESAKPAPQQPTFTPAPAPQRTSTTDTTALRPASVAPSLSVPEVSSEAAPVTAVKPSRVNTPSVPAVVPQVASAGSLPAAPSKIASASTLQNDRQLQPASEPSDLLASASLASDIPRPLAVKPQPASSDQPEARTTDHQSAEEPFNAVATRKSSSKLVSPIASEQPSPSAPLANVSTSAHTAVSTARSSQTQSTPTIIASASSAADSLSSLRADLNYLLVAVNDADAVKRLGSYTHADTFVTISGTRYVQVGVYSASRVGNYLLRQKLFQLTQAGFTPRTVTGASMSL